MDGFEIKKQVNERGPPTVSSRQDELEQNKVRRPIGDAGIQSNEPAQPTGESRQRLHPTAGQASLPSPGRDRVQSRPLAALARGETRGRNLCMHTQRLNL